MCTPGSHSSPLSSQLSMVEDMSRDLRFPSVFPRLKSASRNLLLLARAKAYRRVIEGRASAARAGSLRRQCARGACLVASSSFDLPGSIATECGLGELARAGAAAVCNLIENTTLSQ